MRIVSISMGLRGYVQHSRSHVRSGLLLLAILLACHHNEPQITKASAYRSLAEARAHAPAGWPGLYIVDGVPLQDTTRLPPEDHIASVEFVNGSECVNGRALMGVPCWPVLMITTLHVQH